MLGGCSNGYVPYSIHISVITGGLAPPGGLNKNGRAKYHSSYIRLLRKVQEDMKTVELCLNNAVHNYLDKKNLITPYIGGFLLMGFGLLDCPIKNRSMYEKG